MATPIDNVIFIVVFSTCALILLCYLVSRRYIGAGAGAEQPTQATATRGLDNEIIESFPTMLYSEVKQFNQQQGGILECAVCLSEFHDADTLRLLPGCNHAFHLSCIGTWLDSHTSCPVCRADLTSGTAEAPAAAAESTAVQVDEPGEDEVEPETRDAETQVWTEEERERFTLRLPESVRSELMARRLERSATMDCGILRKGKRRGWSFDIDKWALIGRTWSRRSPLGGGGRGRCREVPSPLAASDRTPRGTNVPEAPATAAESTAAQVEEPVEDAAEPETRVWTEEEWERFTLRLPESVRSELMARRLERSTTMDSRILRKGKRGGWSFGIDKWALIGRTWSRWSPLGGGGRRRAREVPSPQAASEPTPRGSNARSMDIFRLSPTKILRR